MLRAAKHSAAAMLAASLLAPSLATAQEDAPTEVDVEFYDSDDDGYISISEARALTERLTQARGTTEGSALLIRIQSLEPEFEKQKYVKIEWIKSGLVKNRLVCNQNQTFYLQANILEVPILDCPERRPDSLPASIAFTGNLQDSIDTLQLGGVLAIAVVKPGQVPLNRAAIARGGLYLSDMAALFFIESQGQLVSGNPTRGYHRIGLNTEFELAGGVFDASWIDITPYWQTDFGFDGSAYGVSIAWSFQDTDINLGGFVAPGKKPNRYSYWTLDLISDIFHVTRPGGTSLVAGDDYAWLGGKVGFRAFYAPERFPNGFSFNADASAFWDAVSGRSVGKFTTSLNYNLDLQRRTSIGLSYDYGTSKETLEKTNLISLNFKAKF